MNAPQVGQRYLSEATGNIFRVHEVFVGPHSGHLKVVVVRENAPAWDDSYYVWLAELLHSMTLLED
jgi:hypothetical protein